MSNTQPTNRPWVSIHLWRPRPRSREGESLRFILERLRPQVLRAAVPGDLIWVGNLPPEGSLADIDYLESSVVHLGPVDHLKRLVHLADAYAAPRTPLTGAGRLLESLGRGLTWWMDYGPTCSNWWYRDISGAIQNREDLFRVHSDEGVQADHSFWPEVPYGVRSKASRGAGWGKCGVLCWHVNNSKFTLM